MRKIDAVLLSALIVYDYSAQSLVDNDVISFGNSFTNNEVSANVLTDSDYSFTPDFANPEMVIRSAKKISPDDIDAVKESKNISFYELAKVNPETAPAAYEDVPAEDVNISINIPASADMDIAVPETFSVAAQTVETVTENYAETVTSTEKINIQVAAEADPSTFDDDGDGIFNGEDKCPGVAGVARFEGCPVPDSDADGVNDEEDRCPFEIGTEGNYGCPVSVSEAGATEQLAAETVTANQKNSEFNFTVGFNKDNKILSSEDFNIVLQLTDILVRTPAATIEIEGIESGNHSSPQTPVELLANYFKDLGVSANQIIIKTQVKALKDNSATGNSRIGMSIKL